MATLAAIMGNVLEFYDFSIYAYFAPEIGKLFFPKGSPTIQVVKTFTVFAGGFLMRPVGSVVLGAVGDKYGTAAALKWSIALMTIPTVVTGLLPTYHKVGLAAPLLLTLCRLVQGLSVGGELIGALLHTADHSPPGRRGLYCGIVGVFGSVGNLIGAVVSVSMRKALTERELLSWGWRIPFLTGSVLGFVGVLLRTQTDGLRSKEEHKAKKRVKKEQKEAARAAKAAARAARPEVPYTPTASHRPPTPPSASRLAPLDQDESVDVSSPLSPTPSTASSSGEGCDIFDVDLVEAAIHKEQEDAAEEDEEEEDDEEEGEEEEEEEEEDDDEEMGNGGLEDRGETAANGQVPPSSVAVPMLPVARPLLAPAPPSVEADTDPAHGAAPLVKKRSRTKKILKKLKLKKKKKNKDGKGKRKSFLQILRDAAGTDKARFLYVVLLATLQSSQFYLHFVWVGTYLAVLARKPITSVAAFSVITVMQVLLILTGPFWGLMGDKYGGAKGRVKWLIAGIVCDIIMVPTAFSLLERGGESWAFAYAVMVGLTMGLSLGGNYHAWVTETLQDSPARVLSTSVAYNLGAMTGGCAPMLYSALSAYRFPQIAPVLPPIVYGGLVLAVFIYSRASPRGIFHVSKWEEKREQSDLEGMGGGEELKEGVEVEMAGEVAHG
ncbi:hypothetical protein NSK_005587 [Nannochloropsis salina CCMP1776]|uniref:Major facilitator superfamily (MFS) profile domain-containing protein n=1 Tax=Nannochloropsis salina CCMP1776 TaxID=1027361 RepID=A0A4D9D3B6_9STRA|nr:hypothetical protein NSK_005587 [Nannochloropsis salina CCMP1776]|eukprot:TFJ83118.1 hypothetical protein NSK_005587 [Nannochloropsis salina CCMP1776]